MQHEIPALQSVSSRQCVGCGDPGRNYCSGCGITPYCSERCQRRDWADRHRAVCHNLARYSDDKGFSQEQPVAQFDTKISPAPPLRPPRDVKRDEDSGSGTEKNIVKKSSNKSNYNNKGSSRNFTNKKSPADARRPGAKDSAPEPEEDWEANNSVPKSTTPQKAPKSPPPALQQAPKSSPPAPQQAPKSSPPAPQQAPKSSPPAPQQAPKSSPPAPQQAPKSSPPAPQQAPKSSPPAPQQAPKSSPPAPQQAPKVSPAIPKRAPKISPAKPQSIPEITDKPVNKELESTAPEAARETSATVVTSPVNAPKVKPGSVADVTPGYVTRLPVPKQYLIETLDIGDSVVLSIDADASSCRSKPDGFVCLSMSERYEADYKLLCDNFGETCEETVGDYKLVPGESCAYFDPADGGWYRARCLTPTTLALLDASRVVTLAATDRCIRLPAQYETTPEFCCLLRAEGVQVGASVTCQLLSKDAEGFRVSLQDNETLADVGRGLVTRWVPAVDYAVPKPVIPEVSRPDVTHNDRVLLVHATAMDKAFVRAADAHAQREYDDVLEQVVLYGRSVSPLKEPPAKGDTVLSMFGDGLHYRALCKRTNVKQNKYMLEYIDFGNVEISPIEKLYPCPAHLTLSAVPARVSHVKIYDTDTEFTPPALEYVEKLKDDNEELILTLAGDVKSQPSGAVVTLTVAKNRENVNKKLADMCTAGWRKIEERGGDVVETAPLMYDEVEFLSLPAGGCTLDVLDVSTLTGGILSACPSGLPHAQYVLNQLTRQMAEYCNSEIGRQPYLPKTEELCIAQFPPYPQWFRAVVAEQVSGAGGDTVRVCYLDYGNMAEVSTSLLRKMLPDFLTGLPVLALHIEIRDFPKNLTQDMLLRAAKYMKINEEGRGVLDVTQCTPLEPGVYLVEAPGLIAAMTNV